jgi:hypothetical protein
MPNGFSLIILLSQDNLANEVVIADGPYLSQCKEVSLDRWCFSS